MIDDAIDVPTSVIVSMVSMVETNFMFSEVHQYFSNFSNFYWQKVLLNKPNFTPKSNALVSFKLGDNFISLLVKKLSPKEENYKQIVSRTILGGVGVYSTPFF